MSRLQERYQQDVVPNLRQELGVANVHQVPRIQKVVLNVGLGKASSDKRMFEVATDTLRKITGQQPVTTKAKQSVAGFKLREGQNIGLKVTLRRGHMYDFLERVVNVVLPRIRDFRGLSPKAFDPQGNYSIGLSDQSVFPELTYEDTTMTHGLQINIVIDSPSPEASKRMLELLGFPFEGSQGKQATHNTKAGVA